uniref:RING-type domain-containing protein n=1 Tax=Meloidogyne javanica TaxID=6303 RepID=A0A915MYG7_MELJA
ALNIGQKFLGTFEDEQKFVCKEILIPRILTTQSEEDMAKMQKISGIVEYLYRDSKQDGMRTIILRGTSDSIVKAEKELEIMTAKIKRKSNSVSSVAKSFINETKNAENNDISVSAFSVQSSKHQAKNFISTEYPNNIDKNEPIFDSEERCEAEIRELRSENEKLKRQVALKDRELVRLNAVRSCFGCNSSQRSVIFLPCAHFLFCVRCADRNEKCQICNVPRTKRLVKYE